MKRNAVLGGFLWAGLAAGAATGHVRLGMIELLFLLAPLVIVPLGLELSSRLEEARRSSQLERLTRWVQFPAALLVVASFWLAAGNRAAGLTVAWFLFGGLLGLQGLERLFRGGYARLDAAGTLMASLYLTIGCAWLVASRAGLAPLGFEEPIVLLTAVHFHYAGFAAPLLARAAGKDRQGSAALGRIFFRIVATGVLASPGLLAAGFVVGPRFKLTAALVLAASQVGLAMLFAMRIQALRPRTAQFLIGISAASVFFGMLLAGALAIGEYPLQPFVHLAEMARFHGTANAFGFTLCGLLGWTVALNHTTFPRRSHSDERT